MLDPPDAKNRFEPMDLLASTGCSITTRGFHTETRNRDTYPPHTASRHSTFQIHASSLISCGVILSWDLNGLE